MYRWSVYHAETRAVLAEGTATETPTARRDAGRALDRLVEDLGFPSVYESPLHVRVVPLPQP